ncbi:MAG: YihY/virulence factor BrkB family protein [Anaerolineales bacterium]|nr:YihY/virulence factor BrkB family protein [Anaerolineales bacterium]
MDRVKEMLPAPVREVVEVVVDTATEFGEDECGLRAAALAYYALLSVFPLLLFLIFITSVVIEAGGIREALISYVERAVPQLANPAADLLERTIESSASFGLAGALGLLWTASALFTVLSSTFNVIWEADPRSLWHRRLIGLLSVIVVAIMFVFSILARTLLAFDLAAYTPLARTYVNTGVDLGVTVVLSWILYTWLPNRKVDVRASLAAAVFTALLWQAAKIGFGLYLSTGLERFGAVYGSLVSVIVLVLWVYISSLILFLGAEFGATLQVRHFKSS